MVSDTLLIGLDWGSSSLRAMRIGAGGIVLETRFSSAGASSLKGGEGAFQDALDELIGDWHGIAVPVVACGMVGSQHGWHEVPYVDCPATFQQLLGLSKEVDWRGRKVQILPGLRYVSGAGIPDVMRGEETQIVGALKCEPALGDGACLVLPGTHSKWASVRGDRVLGFATHLTGELFALLRQHSVLGRLMPTTLAEGNAHSEEAFQRAVNAVRDRGGSGLTHQLFSVRTLGLMKQIEPDALPDYLSGLLIGHEVRAGMNWRVANGLEHMPLRLIGEAHLCERYQIALKTFGEHEAISFNNTSPGGLWGLATQDKS